MSLYNLFSFFAKSPPITMGTKSIKGSSTPLDPPTVSILPAAQPVEAAPIKAVISEPLIDSNESLKDSLQIIQLEDRYAVRRGNYYYEDDPANWHTPDTIRERCLFATLQEAEALVAKLLDHTAASASQSSLSPIVVKEY